MTGVQTCALRSEEHTSELQSHDNIVCRLLLEKKNSNGHHGAPATIDHTRTGQPRTPAAAPQRPDESRVQGARRERTGVKAKEVSFFFNDSATPKHSPLSLPRALPI